MRTPAPFLVAVALAACASGETATVPPPPATPASPQGPASNTGFFGLVTVGEAYKLYMPSALSPTEARAHLAVVDAAAPHGTSGLLRFIDLGGPVATPQAVAAGGDDVVVVSASTPTVYFVSASSDTVRATATLPDGAGPILVSGNAPWSTGVAVDPSRRRAWAATSLGLAEYDLDARAPTGVVLATPPTENFAYDPDRRAIYSPFYLCDPAFPSQCTRYAQPGGPDLTDSLTVVDLASGGAYTFVDPSAADPHAPLGFEPDAVAYDRALGVAVVVTEDPPALHLLDMGAAVFDRAAMTCAFPVHVTIPMPAGEFSAVTVDPATHLAVAAQEAGAVIAFVNVERAMQGAPAALLFTMPDLPGGEPWVTRVDPHGVGVGLLAGKPYLFVANITRTAIARVDLERVAAFTLSGGGDPFASAVAYVTIPIPP